MIGTSKTHRLLIGCLVAIFTAIPSLGVAQDTSSQNSHLTLGIKYAQNQDYEKSIAELKLAMEEEPQNPAAFYTFGRVCVIYKDWAEKRNISQALKVYNANLQNIENAFKKTIELLPNEENAYRALIRFYAPMPRKRKEIMDVLRTYFGKFPARRELIEQDPVLYDITHSDGYRMMIADMMSSGNGPLPLNIQALNEYTKAIKLIQKGQLQSKTAKAGLSNLKNAIDNFDEYPKAVVVYSVQAEMDFEQAIKSGNPQDKKVLSGLLKTAQNLDSDATYRVGIFYLDNGGPGELSETEAQFRRIDKINPGFKNIGTLLNTSKIWIPMGQVKSVIREVQSRIEQFSEREGAMDFERETIQQYILDPLGPLLEIPKDVFEDSTTVVSLLKRGQELADKASQGFPKVELQITLDRKKIKNNSFVTLPSRTEIAVRIKGDLSDRDAVFVTNTPITFLPGTTSAIVTATAKSREIPPVPPAITVAANSAWKFLPTRAAGCIVRSHVDPQPFDTNYFGELRFPGYRKLREDSPECSWDSNKCMTVKNLKPSYVN